MRFRATKFHPGEVWRGWPGWGEGTDGTLCLIVLRDDEKVTWLELDGDLNRGKTMDEKLDFCELVFKTRIA